MHKVQPNQSVRIIQIEVAVAADRPDGEVADELSAMFTNDMLALDGGILDWQYTGVEHIVEIGDDPEEGEVFVLAGTRAAD